MHRIHHVIRRIASADLPTVREGMAGEARPATNAELLNFGIIHLADDVYSCVEQVRYDAGAEEWFAHGHAPVGELLAHGVSRYDALPDSVRSQVLKAIVITSDTPGGARRLVTENIDEQAEAVLEYVGPGVIDLSSPKAVLEEGRRLVAMPESGVGRISVSMADLDEGIQIVEDRDVVPHSWAGEPRPPRRSVRNTGPL